MWDSWFQRLQTQERFAMGIVESLRDTNPVVIPHNDHGNGAILQAVGGLGKSHLLADVPTRAMNRRT